jgi:hypothetical protein
MPLPTVSSMSPWFGVWARPPDRPAQAALVLAVALFIVALVPGGPRWLASRADLSAVTDLKRRRRFLTVASFVAAFFSLGYIAFYLRGGPRAQEASTYWLQGRALSHGLFSWAVPGPSASFRARNLLLSGADRISGAFPPGYPMLLAVGFLVGAPMLIGPLLAAAITIATWFLAHEVGSALGSEGAEPEAIARAASALSIISVALRYCTADAVPDGAIALAVAIALACALRARRIEEPRLFVASGLAVGALAAMGPSTALAVTVVVAVLAVGASKQGRGRSLVWACVAVLPGVVLWLTANYFATGHAFVSPLSAYAALLGDAAHSTGLAPGAWLLQRAREHLVDIANLEPLAILAVVPLVARETRRRAAPLALAIAGEATARWFAHRGLVSSGHSHALVATVPLEHALMAVGLGRLFPRSFGPAFIVVVALALAGFAVHASYEHEALATGDLGRPRFEPDVPREANVAHGLLFFDDDSGYQLAHDPGVVASHGILAARMRSDDHDRLLYDSLGHPPAHHYMVADAGASISLWAPSNAGSDAWRFEAESEWPPLAVTGGWTEPVTEGNSCVSGGAVLRLTPETSRVEASTALELPVPHDPSFADRRAWLVVPRVLQQGGDGKGTLTLERSQGTDPPLAEWVWSDLEGSPDPGHLAKCVDLPARALELDGEVSQLHMVLRARGGSVTLDKTTLSRK